MIFNMDIINKINERYKFKIKQIRPDCIIITTGLNEWMVEIGEPKPYKKHIVLKHKNIRYNRERWHIQGKFYDCKWVLGYINYHDNPKFRLS